MMERSSISTLLVGTLAALALVAAAPAKASTSIHISVGVPAVVAPVQVRPQPVYVPAPQPVYAPPVQRVQVPVYPAAYGHPYQGGRPVAAAYRTARWEPHVRYMPGQVVQRRGTLWVAKNSSARVWNENSPPELSPRLWAPAAYR